MKIKNWYFALAAALLVFSASSYLTQIYIFKRVEDTFFYMLQDLSFVPVQVLIVTLILDRLLKKREKQSLLDKLNMVIGVFFHEVGNGLIELFIECTNRPENNEEQLKISQEWKDEDFLKSMKNIRINSEMINFEPRLIARLREYMESRREHILRLLSNPNLLEHDSFTDLLWAVFHLADELFHRESFESLPGSDIDHLKGDIVRAYMLIVDEWLSYVMHLKKDYPYLFSIAIRTNPFNSEALITVG